MYNLDSIPLQFVARIITDKETYNLFHRLTHLNELLETAVVNIKLTCEGLKEDLTRMREAALKTPNPDKLVESQILIELLFRSVESIQSDFSQKTLSAFYEAINFLQQGGNPEISGPTEH